MNRLVETNSDLTAKAYERKIESLEKERLLIQDRLQNTAKSKASPHQIFELAPTFLANPRKIWESGNLVLQKLTLRLAFSEGLAYRRNEGFRTPKTTLPFKVLGGFDAAKCKNGAPGRIRTRDPLITNQVLYQLSYKGSADARYHILPPL
jgi:site-specific DNA recombinase